MKYIPVSLIIGVTILWCGSSVRADEASKSAKAEELLQLTQGDQMLKMMEPMMKGMVAQMDKDMSAEQRAKVGEMQGKMMALIAVRLSKAKPALVKVYTDTYTEEEIDGILAFYKSPVGKAFLQKMPEVMQRSMPGDDAADGGSATGTQNNDGRNEGKVQVTDYVEKGSRIRNRHRFAFAADRTGRSCRGRAFFANLKSHSNPKA
jgi:hypothetical protein